MTPTTRSDRLDGIGRIAVLRANGIGDFLVVVPALAALRAAYPEASITILGDAWLPGLVAGRPGPWDEAVVVPRYPGLRGVPVDAAPADDVAAFLETHRARYDLVLQMHGGGATSNGFVNKLQPAFTAGARTPDAEPLDRWVPYVPDRHEVLRWLEVAALVGAGGPPTLEGLAPRLTVTERDLAESRRVWPSDEPAVVFHTGARDERRRWPARNFVELGRRLLNDRPGPLLLIGGDADRERSAAVSDAVGDRCHDLTGRLSLSGTAGLIARSTLFVGNDSGPRHLATAVGTPTVGLFWVTNALTYGPLVGKRDRTLIAFRMSCAVCGEPQWERRCGHDVSFLEEITVDAAHAATLAVTAEDATDVAHPQLTALG